MSNGGAAWLVATDSIATASTVQKELAALEQRSEVVAPAALDRELQTDRAGVVLDAGWSDAGAWMTRLARELPELPVIFVGGDAYAAAGIAAMKEGATDFVRLPPSPSAFRLAIDKAQRRHASLGEAPPPAILDEESTMVGRSVVMKQLMSKLRRAARGMSTVLVHGESGTGKELVARQLHLRSPRKDEAFVKVHCGALPDNLLESELFGYEKGAFTGADAQKPGRFELAEGGTLFLDEIGEISPAVQVKLLRVLQDRAYERLGGTETLHADVRFVCATHRDLQAMVKKGTFRQDLFYRLNVVRIVAPTLRSRLDDVPALVARFVSAAAETNRLPEPEVTEQAVRLLQGYAWPGNVRQLQHIVERLVVMTEGPAITETAVKEELALEATPEGTIRGATIAPRTGGPELSVEELAVALRIAERRALEKALKKAGDNRNLAARLLGISRRKLFYMLKDHELS